MTNILIRLKHKYCFTLFYFIYIINISNLISDFGKMHFNFLSLYHILFFHKILNHTLLDPLILWFRFFRHGVRQRLSCWFDGPSYISQCPIQAGQTFTYEFTLVQQKGTLLWHAHFSWLRGTVYGAIVVYPKNGVPYPFKPPDEEHIIILGKFLPL